MNLKRSSAPTSNRLLQARCIVETSKNINAEVLYTGTPIAFLQGVDPELGMVVDKKHDLFGKNFSRKVLVFPNAVGSSVGAYVIYRLKKNHKAPLAMINQVADIITASGCAISNIPLFDLPSATIQQLSYSKSIRLDADGRITLENK